MRVYLQMVGVAFHHATPWPSILVEAQMKMMLCLPFFTAATNAANARKPHA